MCCKIEHIKVNIRHLSYWSSRLYFIVGHNAPAFTYGELEHFSVNPKFYPTELGRNLGLRAEIRTSTYGVWMCGLVGSDCVQSPSVPSPQGSYLLQTQILGLSYLTYGERCPQTGVVLNTHWSCMQLPSFSFTTNMSFTGVVVYLSTCHPLFLTHMMVPTVRVLVQFLYFSQHW